MEEGKFKIIPHEQTVRHTDASSARKIDFSRRAKSGSLPELIVGKTTDGKVIRTVVEPTNVPRK